MRGIEHDHLSMLSRRRDYLRGQIAERGAFNGPVDFRLAEKEALDWAIPILFKCKTGNTKKGLMERLFGGRHKRGGYSNDR